ncbi:MAG: O-antigen ligase family protein [Sporolactobacillus sp.]
MATLLMPISIFIKNFNPQIYMYYLGEFPIYLYLFVLLAWLSDHFFDGKRRMATDLIRQSLNRKVALCIGIVFISQFFAFFLSAPVFHESLKGVVFQWVKLVIVFALVAVHYAVVRLTVTDVKSVRKFMTGVYCAMLVLALVTFAQLLYLFFTLQMAKIVSFLGVFEYRYDRAWYSAGSYVQTLGRINAFNPESDYLAVQLLVCFVPFLLAAIKWKTSPFFIRARYNRYMYGAALVYVCVILFFAKTTTGLLAILLIVFCVWLLMSWRGKITLFSSAVLVTVFAYFMGHYSKIIGNILNDSIFYKLQEDSSMNRMGSIIGLFKTWLHHPLLGVGYSNHSPFLFHYLPAWTTHNAEYGGVFLPQHFYPILSTVLGWLAEMGPLFIVFAAVYVVRLYLDLARAAKILGAARAQEKAADVRLLCTLCEAGKYFFIFFALSTLFIFNWYESIYLLLIFFFVALRRIAQKYIEQAAADQLSGTADDKT